MIVVKIEYNTDSDGNWIEAAEMEEPPCTLHGPFKSDEVAFEWMNYYRADDTDIYDAYAIDLPKDTDLFINKVERREMRNCLQRVRRRQQKHSS